MGKLVAAILFFTIVSRIDAQPNITRYDLDYHFDFEAKKVFCTANISITPGDTLNLLLYRLLTVRSISDGHGRNIRFSQRVSSFIDWEQFQVNAITVPVHNITQLQIDFDGYLNGYTETGMLYTKDHIDAGFTILRPDCFAYPVPGTMNWQKNVDSELDWFDYKVSVTVPDSLTVVNGGTLLSKINKDKQATYVYVNKKASWRIDIAIGKYKSHVEDEFIIQYFPEDSVKINTTARYVKEAFALFGSWFGKRSDQLYTIIEIPDKRGSQTDVTSILQEASAIKDEKHLYELYHEISHTWNVTPLEGSPCRVESEGLAVFLQYLLMEKLHRNPGALDAGAERSFQKIKKQFDRDPKTATIPISEYGANQLTDLSYTKGMLFFYVLYKKVGEEEFIKAIAGYLSKYRNGASLTDFSNSINSSLEGTRSITSDWLWTARSSEKILRHATFQDFYASLK